MNGGTLVRAENGHVQCSGRLTFDSVTALMQRSDLLWQGQGALVVDLAGVDRSDSAGLALLVDWTRRARAAGREIQFIHVPAQLWAIAEVSGLEAVLPLQR